MPLFKGYIPTKNKKSIMTFKGKNASQLLTFEEAQKLPEFGGVLAAETVLVDIDDFESSEILFKIVQDRQLKCKVYKTTRGKHFYFRNNGVESNKTHCTTAISLVADMKLGTRNSYSILKFKGELRPVILDIPEDQVQEIPKWLLPIKTSMEFLHMESGDGRNQALFNYILTLQSNDFSVEEARETIRIINAYMLKEPLNDRELSTILRDDAFQKPVFFKKSKFQHEILGKYLIRENNIISVNGQVHIYQNGIYTDNIRSLHRCMIDQIGNITKSQRNEVLAYIETMAPDTELSDINKIPIKNGLYDLETGKLEDFTPLYVSKNLIPVAFKNDSYDSQVDRFLNDLSCNDTQIRAIIEEMIGCCIYRTNVYQALFVLVGIGANGKSTLLKLLTMMLGKDNVSSVDLKDLEKTFKPAELYGKLANIGDDISSEQIKNSSFVKKLSSGERSNVERKGKDPFEFNSYATLIFSCNTIPRINDHTNGLSRRLVFIPFNNVFECDPEYERDILKPERLEYLLKLGIEGLQRYLRNNGFTKSKEVERTKKDYLISNNPVLAFLDEIDHEAILNESTEAVFLRFKTWCAKNNYQYDFQQPKFTAEVKKVTGYGTKKQRIPQNADSSKKAFYRVYVPWDEPSGT